MAAYFWVGGTGTWSGTGNTQFAVTTGGTPTLLDPTNADSVTFDANSGTAATVTVTTTAVSLDTTINKADITLLLSGSPTLCTAAGTCTLTAGTLDLNSYTLTTGLFSSTNSNTRTLAFGTGNITLTGVNTTIFTTSTATNMTITGAPVVNCTATTGTALQTRIFTAGSFVEAQSISVNINPGTSAVDIFRLATTNGSFKDVTFSSTFTGTVQIANPINIFGNLDFGGATAYTGVSAVTFAATSGIKTIRTNGRTFGGGVTFSGVGGAWNCSDNLSAAGTLTLTAGTFNLNSYNLTAAAFSSNNSNVRTFTQGSGSFTVTGSSATIWNTGTSTNLTYTTTPTVNANYSGAVGSRTINTDATSPINLNVTAGTDTITNVAGSGFNNLDFTGFAGTLANVGRFIYGNLILSTGMTLTAGALITQFSGVGTATITSNTQTFTNLILYSEQFDNAVWTKGVGLVVTADTTVAPDSTTTGDTVTADSSISIYQGVTSVIGIAYTQSMYIKAGGGNPATSLLFRDDTGAGRNITVNPATGVVTSPSGTLISSGSTSVGNGWYRIYMSYLADTTTVRGLIRPSSAGLAQTFFVWGAQTEIGATLTTYIPTTATTASITGDRIMDFPVTFNGTGTTNCLDALTLGSTRALTFTNGTLNLKSGVTSTVGSFVTTGTTAKYLGSTTPGTQATISDASGTDTVSYLTIKDSNATGGATWNALAITNVDAGNNTGWLFSTTPSVSNEVTMRLRSFTQPRRF